jgi:hypothetical protein
LRRPCESHTRSVGSRNESDNLGHLDRASSERGRAVNETSSRDPCLKRTEVRHAGHMASSSPAGGEADEQSAAAVYRARIVGVDNGVCSRRSRISSISQSHPSTRTRGPSRVSTSSSAATASTMKSESAPPERNDALGKPWHKLSRSSPPRRLPRREPSSTSTLTGTGPQDVVRPCPRDKHHASGRRPAQPHGARLSARIGCTAGFGRAAIA